MAINFDIRDPKTQKMIAVLMVPVVVLYVFFHFMIEPKLGEIEFKLFSFFNYFTVRHNLFFTRKPRYRESDLLARVENRSVSIRFLSAVPSNRTVITPSIRKNLLCYWIY